MSDARWNPAAYERFKDQRSQPFYDLLTMIPPAPGGRVVDLGCGTGELTKALHLHTGAAVTTGIDSSAAMLEKAAAHGAPGLEFHKGTIEAYAPEAPLDLVFSNAAVHWVEDHPALFARHASFLAPGGRIAAQLPANHTHPSHRIAVATAREAPFATALGGWVREAPVLTPERYSALAYALGFREINVQLRVYGHELESAHAVVEWVKSSLLLDYAKRMPEALYAQFSARYTERLVAELGPARPYWFTFNRILLVLGDRTPTSG